MLNTSKTSRFSIWFIAVGAAMWGLDSVLITALLHHFSPTEIVFFEHSLLMLFAIPVLIWKRNEWKYLNMGDWLSILFLSWGGSAIASVLFTAGFQFGNPNVVLLLQKTQPLFAVLLASLILKEQLPRYYWMLFPAALAGTFLLTFGFDFSVTKVADNHSLLAVLFALGAAFLWGGSTVMGKRVVAKVSFPTITALRFAIALPLLSAMVLGTHPHFNAIEFAFSSPNVWLNLLFQTLFPSLFGLLIYYLGLHGVKASYATLAELAFPATGLLLNWAVLHETIDFGQWIGFFIIWIAVSFLSFLPSEKRTKAPAGRWAKQEL